MSDENTYIRIRMEGCECSGCVLTIDEACEELKAIHASGDESGFMFEPVVMSKHDFESMPEFNGF